MGTQVAIISNIKTSKEEQFSKKDWFVQQLKQLNIKPMKNSDGTNTISDWFFQINDYQDLSQETEELEYVGAEIIYYESETAYNLTVYENCLEIGVVCRYEYLYSLNLDYLKELRLNIYNIISIFGGTEVIYLCDNEVDKISNYLCNNIWEGVSYFDVKNAMFQDGIPFLNLATNSIGESVDYEFITEYIFDDFSDFGK